MVLLTTILILVLVYYSLKLLLRWFGPKLFAFAMKKAEQKFAGQAYQSQTSDYQKTNRDGETTIHSRPAQRKPSKKVGEYIDFEEIP
ncbi:MAG: DUF4834 family protein [Bacteroidota bacterium]